jgi:hypothetical protein
MLSARLSVLLKLSLEAMVGLERNKVEKNVMVSMEEKEECCDAVTGWVSMGNNL